MNTLHFGNKQLTLVLGFNSVSPFPDSCAELACFTVDQLEDERTTGDDAISSGQEVPERETDEGEVRNKYEVNNTCKNKKRRQTFSTVVI